MEKEVSKEEREQAKVLKDQGNEHFKANMFIKAVESYSKAIEMDPSEATYYSNRANANQQLRNFRKCLEDCETALKLDPKFIKVMRRKGLAQQQLGLFDDAKYQFIEALKLSPKDKTLLEDQKLNNLLEKMYERATKSVQDCKYSDAIMEINQIILKVPYWEKIQMLQVEVTALMGNVEKAQSLLQQNKNTWQDNQGPDVYYLQGIIYLYGGRSEQAKKLFTAGMQKDPDNKKCMLALKKTRKCESMKDEGNECLKNKDFEGALQKYDEAIALDKNNSQLNAVIYANKASVYLQQEKYELAVRECNNSIQLNKNYPKSYFRRAEARIKLEEFEAAIHDYKQFQDLDPTQDMRSQIQKAKQLLKISKQKDYYKVLGVPKNALPTEIKKAYRKLALQFHPDRITEPEKKPAAEKKFKEINEAYALLTDPKKKEMIDQGIDPNEQGGGGGGGFDSADIFSQFFGGGGGHSHSRGGFGGGGGGFSFNFQ